MLNRSLRQCFCILVCALIFLNVRGSEGGDDVEITLIPSAVAIGAVCLDGSPPAYQFDKGFGEGINNWLVRFQGGGWCESVDNCLLRVNMSNGLGSSTLMKKFNFTGILSKKQELNPNFYNWNRVIMRYCDGSSFTGDVEEVDPAINLHFRGARIYNAIVEQLLAKGLKNSSNVLLSGCSAGGLATFMHCDKFRALFPQTTKVKCLADAGAFSHVKDVSGHYYFAKYYDQVVKLHGSAKILPSYCTSKMSPSMCFYPQFVLPQIETPIFILNSAYDTWQVHNILMLPEADPKRTWGHCKMNISTCTTAQLQRLKEFRTDFWSAVFTGVNKTHMNTTGWFINTCYTHCQSENQMKWLGDPTSKIRDTTISQAVGDWYYDRGTKTNQYLETTQVMPHYCVIDPPANSTKSQLCMDSYA